MSNDILIDAYLRAYDAGSDIITASIGGESGWSEDAWSVVASRIVEAGVPCTISAGNDGAYGLFYASTASNGKRVTSIASFDNIITPSLLTESYFTVDGGDEMSFGYTPGAQISWANVSLPLWSPSLDIEAPQDGCDPYPKDTPDLSKYIVLVRRGTCPFTQKATNAVEFGARYIMFYNQERIGTVSPSTGGVSGLLASGMVMTRPNYSHGSEILNIKFR